MTSNSATSAPGPRFWLAGAIFAAVAGFVIWDAVVRSRHVLAVSASYGVTVDAPAVVPASPTGYADGRRSLVLPAGSADSAHWVMQTQAMIAAGDWRVRWVDYDNPPAGREVHWAAPFHWWMAGLAWIDHWISGRPIGLSVEYAVIWSGPAMLGLLLLGLTPFLYRRFSPLAALLFVVGTVATFPFYLDFVAAYADHHGIANICGLLTVLWFAAGALEETREPARRWFVASGLAGGTGLWISAATQVPVLLGLGLGVLAAAWLARHAPRRPVWLADPALLRLWGWAGGGMSLAAWLMEYFPHHLNMRLEVNHPLYAAAWVGAGEALRVVVLALRDGVRSLRSRDRTLGVAGAALVILLPAVILFTAAKTFIVADPFVWRIHNLYISEFQGLGRLLGKGLNWGSVELCLPMLVYLPPLWLATRRATPAEVKAHLVLFLLPALLACAMGWSQVRWMSLACALSVPLMAVFFRAGEAGAGRTQASFLRWLLAGALLFGPGVFVAVERTMGRSEFTEEDIHSLAERDIAHWLRLRAGSGRVVVAGSPTPVTKLIYHGSLTGVGTLYWENAAGLKNSAELFAAPSSEAARAVAARLGLTHLVFVSWDSFESSLARLHLGLPGDAPLPADTFAAQLLGSAVPPPWLQPVPFRLPAHPALAGAVVRIWEVVPEQSPATALARAANCFLELGRGDDAQRLVPALSRFGDELPAAVMLAGIASRQRDSAAFAAAFPRVLSRLDRAETLELDERIRLVVVLTVGERTDLARAQLRRCVELADEQSLRHLTTGALADLLTLSDGLGVPLPGPAHDLAVSLLPPDQRK